MVHVLSSPGMFCLRASQFINALVWYLFDHVYAKVYQIWVPSIKSIIGDRAMETSEGQFIGNDGVRIWLEKNGLFVGDKLDTS